MMLSTGELCYKGFLWTLYTPQKNGLLDLFTQGSICLVLASLEYGKEICIRDSDVF